MARWKLTASHYLTVTGSAWEQTEVDQMTGRQIRHRYEVPMQLDIQDPVVWNGNIVRNPRGEILGGDIIVAYGDKEHDAKDYIFTGEPTPDMFPLDEEAKLISASFEDKWKARPDEDMQYGQKLIDALMVKRAEIESKESTVKIDGLPEVLATFGEMMKQNQELLMAITRAPAPAPSTDRRA
jgi:hypothetical protein